MAVLGTRAFEKRKFFDGRPLLVTGATGLLGAHLTQTLVDLGSATVVLVRDRTPLSAFTLWGLESRVTVVRGDVTDRDLVYRILAEYGVEVVFHLAAQTQVGVARENPAETFRVNVEGSVNVLEAVRRTGREIRVVLAGSDKAYGPGAPMPTAEETPLHPVHPYDASKACADLMATAYARAYVMPVGVTRCANLYGGGDLNWERLVPGTIRAALLGEPPVVRSDGKLVRDWLYVKDAVLAYLNLAFALGNMDIWGEAFNFGNEEPMEVLSVVREILALAGRPDLEPVIENRAQDEIPAQHLSSVKAKKLLGYAPRLSFREGMRETIEWYRSYLGLAG